LLKLKGKVPDSKPTRPLCLGPVETRLHIRRQRSAGAGGATGAHQPVQPMPDHNRGERRNLDHLVPQRLWILTPQQGAAAAPGIRAVLQHLIHALDRQQLRPIAGMAWLAPALAATALAPLRRHKPRTIAGGWFGGIARGAADLLPQAGQLCGHGADLCAELLDLLLLSQDQRTNSIWCRRTVASQSASEIPAGGAVISLSLVLRCTQESHRCQWLDRIRVRWVPSRTANRHKTRSKDM
jgi:hypothetical protein